MYKIKFTVGMVFGNGEVYFMNSVKEFTEIPEYFKPYIENGTILVLEGVEKVKPAKTKIKNDGLSAI